MYRRGSPGTHGDVAMEKEECRLRVSVLGGKPLLVEPKINDHGQGANHEPIKIHNKYELGMDPERNKHLQCIFLVLLSSCAFFREQKLSENESFRLPNWPGHSQGTSSADTISTW